MDVLFGSQLGVEIIVQLFIHLDIPHESELLLEICLA